MIQNTCFAACLYSVLGRSAREPASIACEDEQGDLFYSEGPRGNLCQSHVTQGKSGKKKFGTNEVEWTGKVEITIEFLTVGEAGVAVF